MKNLEIVSSPDSKPITSDSSQIKTNQSSSTVRNKPIRKRKRSKSFPTELIKGAKSLKESGRRYPKRREPINYAEAEVPDDDHYLC